MVTSMTIQEDWFPVDIEEYIKLITCRTRIIRLGKAFDIDTLKAIFMVTKTHYAMSYSIYRRMAKFY
jgi:hypothetical protein